MLHLQAQRNLDVFLQRTGVRQFQIGEIMSFVYPDHRLDLAFRANSLLMTTSIPFGRQSDAAFFQLLQRAGQLPTAYVLRIYRADDQIGINGALPDTHTAEAWLSLYQTQKALIKYYLNLNL